MRAKVLLESSPHRFPAVMRFMMLSLSLLPASAQDAVKLDIAPFPLADGARMEFRAFPLDQEPPKNPKQIWSSENCKIFFGSEIGAYDEALRSFKYDLFVRQPLTNPPHWSHFQVNANPTGPFRDQVGDLNFNLTNCTKEPGQMRLPLHAVSAEQYIKASPDSDPVDVWLSPQPIQINLANNLDGMDIVVQSIRLSYTDSSFWNGDPPNLKPNLTLTEKAKDVPVGLTVHANPIKAIQTALLSTSDTGDTSVVLTIDYAAQSGGRPKTLQLPMKVRFVPSPLYIGLTLMVGAFIGCLGRLADQKYRTNAKGFFMNFVSATIASVIFELLGIGLTKLDCSFKLFGMALDPRQLPQVLVMAILVGVFGVKIAETIRAASDKLRPGVAGG